MALPLPNVVADVGPGGPLVTSMRGQNALLGDIYGNQIKAAQAQYAPYTTYADALSKIAYANMLPYQIQAQLLSNPLLWLSMKDNPEVMKNLLGSFSQSVPNINQLGSMLPQPGKFNRSQGLLSKLFDTLGIGSSNGDGNAMQAPSMMGGNNMMTPPMGINSGGGVNGASIPAPVAPPPQGVYGNALVPAVQGTFEGLMGSKLAPFQQSPYKPGALIPDPNVPGGVISVPTQETVSAGQKSINAVQRVTPQLEKLADLAAPFLSGGGMLKMELGRGINYLTPNLSQNFPNISKLPTQYAKFLSVLKSVPEALVKAYGLNPTNETIDRMEQVVIPYQGEKKEQYKARILNTLEEIKKEQGGVSQENIGYGFPIPPKGAAAKNTKSTQLGEPTDDDIEFTAKKYNMSVGDVKKYLGIK